MTGLTGLPGGLFASLWEQCADCGSHHPGEQTCAHHKGIDALAAAAQHHAQWEAETAARLLEAVGDGRHDLLYPLLSVLKVGYGAGQLTKAIGKLLVELTRTRVLVGNAERVVGGVGVFAHQSSPSLIVDSASVGERPGPVEEAGPGHPEGGDQ